MSRIKLYFSNQNRAGKTMWCGLFLMICFLVVKPSGYAVELDVKDTRVTLGGYIKLMMIYDTSKIRTGPYEGDIISATDIPIDGSANADLDDFRMTARESRLFVKTSTPTDIGTLSTHLEGDFFGTGGTATFSNSRAFRLRHAYGSLTRGPHVLLAGQAYSTFMDLAAALPPIDLSSDPGLTFIRQPMVRYQYNVSPGHYLAVAAENPDNGLTSAGVSLIKNPGTTVEYKMPDLVVKYFYANTFMHVSPKAVLRSFNIDDESTTGYGLSLSSHFKLAEGLKLYATLLYGDGMGRYGGLGVSSGVGLTDDGDIATVEFIGYNGGITYALTKELLLSVGYGYIEHDEDAYSGSDSVLTENAFNNVSSWHTHLFWKISPAMDCAFGITGYDKEIMSGATGDMMRYQTYIRYSF